MKLDFVDINEEKAKIASLARDNFNKMILIEYVPTLCSNCKKHLKYVSDEMYEEYLAQRNTFQPLEMATYFIGVGEDTLFEYKNWMGNHPSIYSSKVITPKVLDEAEEDLKSFLQDQRNKLLIKCYNQQKVLSRNAKIFG